MITPPTKSFFVIRIHGEAADVVSTKLSPSIASDVRESVLISDDYSEDIEAQNELDKAIQQFKQGLDADVTVTVEHNPLYFPSSKEQIESVLESHEDGDMFRFIGMDGNPFTLKTILISKNDEPLLEGRVACHQFDLPTYSELFEAQKVRMH